MKKQILSASVALSLCSVLALAKGDRVGNGGVGISCTAVDGKVTIELLDLYEAGNSKLSFELSTDSEIFDAVNERLESVDPEFHDVFIKKLKAIAKNVAMVNADNIALAGMELPPSNDEGAYEIPANCRLVQIANMVEGTSVRLDNTMPEKEQQIDLVAMKNASFGTLFVDQNLHHELTLRSKTALLVHEAVYASHRSIDPAADAVMTRKIVGELLAKNFNASKLKALISEIK